jgi:hypothetical protein
MSAVNVTNVTVLDNPSMFLNPFQFEISYECLAPLKDGKDDINPLSHNSHFVNSMAFSFPCLADCTPVRNLIEFFLASRVDS